MTGLIERFLGNYCPLCRTDNEKGGDSFYAIFRIVVALLFMSHGLQKLLGAFGGVNGSGATAPLFNMFWWAGVIELVAGLLIVLGLFTRLSALIAMAEMIAAYVIAHLPQGIYPIPNKGELALLYAVSFLLIIKHGANKWSVERAFWKKEIF